MIDREAWQRLSALLDEALALDPAERPAWLQALQAREPEVGERVARALAQADSTVAATGAFGRWLAPALAADHPRTLAGTRLGAWRLDSKIGHGGMGEVWLAHRADGLYEAEAAIKLLRSDLSAATLAARFARERAVLARLNHPAITRLLDAGVQPGPDGDRAYLVLELVAGTSLAEHVRELCPLVVDRVRLLLRIAEAVDYAHARLIVHRDLKPSNVLVTARGEPKLLDFGIAGLLDDGETGDGDLTRQTGRGLTLGYAAPEQITGAPIGTAADVFSLGVMLYELLGGTLPFARRHEGRAASERAVLHDEPRRLVHLTPADADPDGPGRPSDAARALGDLEAVAAKALRKDPAQRYGSVRAFIDDLQRWLAHVPVSARGDDWRHRSRLFLRRHALLATATAGVTLALVAGLAVSTWQWRRAESAARQSDQVTRYLTDLLASSSPDQHGGSWPTVLQLLEKSRAEIDERFKDDPDTAVRLLAVMGETYNALNRYDIAIPLFERRIALATARYGADDPRSVDARFDLARVYTSQGSPSKVIELIEPLRGRRGASADDQATLLYQLIVAYARVGRFADAEAAIVEGRVLVARLFPPEDFEFVFFENYVFALRAAQGRWAEAAALIEKTRPSWATAPKHFARFVLVLRRNLLAAHMRLGQGSGIDDEASALVREMDALLGPGNDMVASLRAEWARHAIDAGRVAQAVALHEQIRHDLRAAAVEHPTLRLPRDVARLHARTLALAAPPAQLATEWQQLADAVESTSALAGQTRAETQLSLARSALLLGASDLAAGLLARVRADPTLGLGSARPVNRPLAGRVEQLEAQLARQRGDLTTARALQQRRADELAGLASEADRRVQVAWQAQLDLALTLVLQGDGEAARRALAQADAARPPAWPAGHPLDALREELQARLDGGAAAAARAALETRLGRPAGSLPADLAGLL